MYLVAPPKKIAPKQEDRVIIVGCTSKPEAGDAKEFKNFFQKFLYVPAPDYASRLMLWHHFIRERLEQVSPSSPPRPTPESRPYCTDGMHATPSVAPRFRLRRLLLFWARFLRNDQERHGTVTRMRLVLLCAWGNIIEV